MSVPAFALAWPDAGRARLAIRITIGYSILIHALVLLIPLRDKLPLPLPAGAAGPLTVRLAPRREAPPPVAEPGPPEPVPGPQPRPSRAPLAMPPRALPQPPAFAVPPAEPAPGLAREPAFDMSALIAANRERRLAREAAVAGGLPPRGAPAEGASEGLARNLASLARGDGTGGVFSILRVGARTAEFSFNGWRTDRSRRWREVIEVDAGPGGDIERAIVRRMIALIRGHYSGNFNWESQRAGRVVVLSAAPEYNDELEEYMMREFFGTPRIRRTP